MSVPPIQPGQVITADWLNKIVRSLQGELKPGWGSGLVSGGRGAVAQQSSYLTAMFKASEDFAEEEDIYKGKAKLWERNPDKKRYENHGDDIDVWSHDGGVAKEDVFPAFFNMQSGRWERIGSGGGTKLVLIAFTGEKKRCTAIGHLLRITVPDHEGVQAGLDVTVERINGIDAEAIEVVNPRNNFLQPGSIYPVFNFQGKWIVDNAGFEDWVSGEGVEGL
jgi:hypothetical protein